VRMWKLVLIRGRSGGGGGNPEVVVLALIVNAHPPTLKCLTFTCIHTRVPSTHLHLSRAHAPSPSPSHSHSPSPSPSPSPVFRRTLRRLVASSQGREIQSTTLQRGVVPYSRKCLRSSTHSRASTATLQTRLLTSAHRTSMSRHSLTHARTHSSRLSPTLQARMPI
jgi:hypothetical protein